MFKLKESKLSNIPPKLCVGRFRVGLQKIGGKISVNKSFGTDGNPLSIVEFNALAIDGQQPVDEPKQVRADGTASSERTKIGAVNVGSRYGWKLDMKNDASGGNLVSFLAATLGVENPQDQGQVDAAEGAAKEMGEAILGRKFGSEPKDAEAGAWGFYHEAVSSDKQPLLGEELMVEVQARRTNKGYLFLPHAWYPIAKAAAEKPAA